MAIIYKPKGRRKYRIKYKDSHRTWTFTACHKYQQATQKQARELETQAEQENAGIPIAAKAERNKPIAGQVAEWLADLARLDRSRQYRKQARMSLNKIIRWTGFTTLASFNLDRFAAFIAD